MKHRRPLSLRRVLSIAAVVFTATVSAQAQNLGNAWHIPDSAEVGVQMRNPRFEIGPNTTVTIYNGNQFQGSGTPGDQSGGILYYKARSSNAPWSQAPMIFNSQSGNNKYWRASFNTADITTAFGPNEVIQYYLRINYSDRATTFVYGGDSGSQTTATESVAAGNPFTIRNRPAFLFHGNNRVLQGQSVQFWVKAGYIGKDDSFTSRWADQARIYYTTDPNGPPPGGSLGEPAAGSQVVTMNFDHRENDPSPAGNAMWWEGTIANLPNFTNIRYKIGMWHSSNNEEKFADYVAGANNETFQFSIGTIGEPTLTVNGVNGNYTTTKLFVNEVLNESTALNIVFIPKQANVDPSSVQIYTNLNRRDRATVDADGDGTEDGIHPPNGNLVGTGDEHYYRAYTMAQAGVDEQGNARYTLTLPANKTGAYRLTARYRYNGESNWHYYTQFGRRDHAVTISPKTAREMVMYELNTINVEATGVQYEQRSTFDDLLSAANGDNDGFDPFNLEYLQRLGVNWLWFQPIHPQAIQGRQIDPVTGSAFEVGSPYAVKNFFDVMPLMGSDNTRGDGLLEFQNFVTKADSAGVNVMLDAAFNHTAYDVEFAPLGDQLFDTIDGVDNYGPNDEIAEKEARFFSRANDYANRASSESNIGVAPDRGDFGKFEDTYDVFYGSYSALVDNNPGDNGGFNDEGDTFFYFDSDWNDSDGGPNSSTNITRRVWNYFGAYIPHWLTQTGCPPGTPLNEQTTRGIDGLRADFGQGLPPQAWEYIINRARTQKWSFVFMAESLDGGAVTYRSNRHFDVLNENITFAFSGATTTDAYRNIYEGRRAAYGQGLVLLNTTSHDEGNYTDPFEALIRFAANGSVDGVPMIFFGQELGISGGDFGFDRYELNFGKRIPHFKKFNSLKPAWDKVNPAIGGGYYNYGLDQLDEVYSGIAQARRFSPALRSSNRFFLNQIGGNVQPKIFSVAKFETLNGSPGNTDVVFAFANLDRGNAGSPAVNQQGNFDIRQDVDGNGANDYGIKAGRMYDFKNIAAYLGVSGNRRDVFLNRKTGSELLNDGLFVAMNKVPTTDAGWATNPYEAQYLKLYDVTAPSGTPGVATTANSYQYVIGTQATVSWQPAPTDSEGVVPHYRVSITINGNTTTHDVGGATSFTFSGQVGQTAFVTIQSLNPNDSSVSGPVGGQSTVKFLSGTADEDGDGEVNSDEDIAGTNPFDAKSLFQVVNTAKSGNSVTISWSSVSGRAYRVEVSSDLTSGFDFLSDRLTASGTGTNEYTDTNASGDKRFYRVRIVP